MADVISNFATEMISPANEQYKGRKSLAGVPRAPKRGPLAKGRSEVPNGSKSAKARSKRPEAVPISSKPPSPP